MKVQIKDAIRRPIDETFDAIVNPERLTRYFVSHTTGPMEEGRKITWTFEDVGAELEIKVLEVNKPKAISFEWGGSGKITYVYIQLEEKKEDLTSIEIGENSFDMNEADVQRALRQTQGWTDFICSLKAYLYTGINLRKGRTTDNY